MAHERCEQDNKFGLAKLKWTLVFHIGQFSGLHQSSNLLKYGSYDLCAYYSEAVPIVQPIT